jgi:hypothetical protein
MGIGRAGIDRARVVVVYIEYMMNAGARIARIHGTIIPVVERKLMDDARRRITAVDGTRIAVIERQWRSW